jgi:hypothetical protein
MRQLAVQIALLWPLLLTGRQTGLYGSPLYEFDLDLGVRLASSLLALPDS